MEYTGYVQGEVIVLKEPLPVPDGTKVRIMLPKARRKMQGQKTAASHSKYLVLYRPTR